MILSRRLFLVALCVIVGALGVATAAPYRNLLRKVAYDAWWSPDHVEASLAFSSYWISHARKLRYNPDRGLWDFDWSRTESAGLGGLESGQLAWHRGDFNAAITHLEEHQRRSGESEESLFWLAMSYLRQAEARNCLDPALMAIGSSAQSSDGGPGHLHADDEHARMCSLPLVVHHRDEDPSRAAADLFERLLRHHDSDNRLYRWLLNFCYMTVGGFPHEVPADYRIESPFIDTFYGEPSADFVARTSRLTFRDAARGARGRRLEFRQGGRGGGFRRRRLPRHRHRRPLLGASHAA